MKAEARPKLSAPKRNMNVTANVGEVLRKCNKKPVWKNKTAKLTKTLTTGKALQEKVNPMTEDDIDKLFGQQPKLRDKEREKTLVPTKVSTENDEGFMHYDCRDFVDSVKFLRVDDENDRLLSGLPGPSQMHSHYVRHLFEEQSIEDLTAVFKQNYLVGKVIGEGAYATVRVAVYKPKQLKIALKVYEKQKIRQPQRKKSVRRQIKILQILNHPNIVKIHDVVQTNNHLNIAMQYLPGHSLGTYLKAQPNGKICQKTCKKIFRDLTKALAYMHGINIAHRDIKLENIILDENLNPKIIDFGFSTCIQEGQKIKIFCGTPSYMAPEVVQRKQYRGETADVWALGVLLFVSLTGIFPFKGSTDEQLYKRIGNSDYPKNQLALSNRAYDLIGKMLKVNSSQRLTASEVLNHSWFFQGKSESAKKKINIESFDNRKRVYTTNQQNQMQKTTKSKQICKTILERSAKKVLAETCKQNLNLQLRMALMKSPKNQLEMTSFRKKAQNSQNKQNLKSSLKNQKNSPALLFRQVLIKSSNKQNDAARKKQKTTLKTSPKVLELLRIEMKRREQRSKSKSNTNRN